MPVKTTFDYEKHGADMVGRVEKSLQKRNAIRANWHELGRTFNRRYGKSFTRRQWSRIYREARERLGIGSREVNRPPSFIDEHYELIAEFADTHPHLSVAAMTPELNDLFDTDKSAGAWDKLIRDARTRRKLRPPKPLSPKEKHLRDRGRPEKRQEAKPEELPPSPVPGTTKRERWQKAVEESKKYEPPPPPPEPKEKRPKLSMDPGTFTVQLDKETRERVNRFMRATREKLDRYLSSYTFTAQDALVLLIKQGLDEEENH
jgi:hypothetical protein